MKKTLLLLAALAFTAAGTSFAQTAPAATTTTKVKTPKTPAQKADRSAAKMAKELGLNTDQEAKVEQLLLARQQESAALKAKYAADKKAARPEMKAAQDRYEGQFKQILTAEQFAKFSQMRGDRKARAK